MLLRNLNGQLSRLVCGSYLAATLSWRLVAVFVETPAGVAVTGSTRWTAPPPMRTRLLHSGIREITARLFLQEWPYKNMALVLMTLKYHEVEIMAGPVTWIGTIGQTDLCRRASKTGFNSTWRSLRVRHNSTQTNPHRPSFLFLLL